MLFAFDLLHLDGRDLTAITLFERKQQLARLLAAQPRSGAIRHGGYTQADGDNVAARACELGLEGIVSKRIDKPYRSGRIGDWIKIKCVSTDEMVIGGYHVSTADRSGVGALAVGYYDGDNLVYVGHVGAGFSARMGHKLVTRLSQLRLDRPAFVEPLRPDQSRPVHWVRPTLVAQVDYRGWTADGLLRHAAFKGLREDKRARHVGDPRQSTKRLMTGFRPLPTALPGRFQTERSLALPPRRKGIRRAETISPDGGWMRLRSAASISRKTAPKAMASRSKPGVRVASSCI